MITRRKLLQLLPFGAAIAACRKVFAGEAADPAMDLWHRATFKAPNGMTPLQQAVFKDVWQINQVNTW